MWSLIGGIIGWIVRLIFPGKSNERKLGKTEAELENLKRIREAEESMDAVPRATRKQLVERLRKSGKL